MGRVTRFDDTGTARFVTFSCYHHYNLLKTDAARLIFINQLKRLKAKYSIKLFGYVIMINHVHIVLLPPVDVTLGKIIGELKSITARQILGFWRGHDLKIFDKLKVVRNGKERYAVWQRRYYDHNCRTVEKALEKVSYCHKNPVRKGLVDDQGDWSWSSYRSYVGNSDTLVDIDDLEL